MSSVKFRDRCCNPFGKEIHLKTQSLRRVSGNLLSKYQHLKSDDLVCSSCRKLMATAEYCKYKIK